MGGGNSCVFIADVISKSPADQRLFVGDRILEVGGVTINTSDLNVVVAAMVNSTSPIHFVVQSLEPGTVCYH